MNREDKKRKLLFFILMPISIVIVVILGIFLLDTTGTINQGYFRITNLVVSSTVVVNDKDKSIEISNHQADVKENEDLESEENSEKISNLSDIYLDITQKNKIMLLINKPELIEIKDVYIDNININYPHSLENMFIYEDPENMVNLTNENILLNLTPKEKEEQYLININVDNIDFIKNANIMDSEASVIKFDGTILNKLNKDLSDVEFRISFNLNVSDSTGKINVSKIDLKLPNRLLITHGLSIVNENVSRFPFVVK